MPRRLWNGLGKRERNVARRLTELLLSAPKLRGTLGGQNGMSSSMAARAARRRTAPVGARSAGELRPKLRGALSSPAKLSRPLAAAARIRAASTRRGSAAARFRWCTFPSPDWSVPFARLHLALEVDLGALLAILLDDLADILVEDHDVVPLGASPCARRWPCRARTRTWRA